MNVLVVGGSGFIGTALCAELVERGHDVTALSRNPADAELPDGVGTHAGDVTEYESIESAFAGQDAVVNLVALSPLFEPPAGNQQHFDVHLGGTKSVVAAAEERGVDRFLQLSALDADPDGATAYIQSKGRAEAVVRESALDWTIIRPSIVFGDGGEFISFTRLLTTPYLTGLPGGGKSRFQPIWVGDFVPMLAEALEDDGHAGAVYETGGPEVLALADVGKRIYRAEGKSLRVLPVPMALARLGLTVGEFVPGFPMGRDQYRSLRFDNTVADNDVDAFGVSENELLTLAAYLAGERKSSDGADRGKAGDGGTEKSGDDS